MTDAFLVRLNELTELNDVNVGRDRGTAKILALGSLIDQKAPVPYVVLRIA